MCNDIQVPFSEASWFLRCQNSLSPCQVPTMVFLALHMNCSITGTVTPGAPWGSTGLHVKIINIWNSQTGQLADSTGIWRGTKFSIWSLFYFECELLASFFIFFNVLLTLKFSDRKRQAWGTGWGRWTKPSWKKDHLKGIILANFFFSFFLLSHFPVCNKRSITCKDSLVIAIIVMREVSQNN